MIITTEKKYRLSNKQDNLFKLFTGQRRKLRPTDVSQSVSNYRVARERTGPGRTSSTIPAFMVSCLLSPAFLGRPQLPRMAMCPQEALSTGRVHTKPTGEQPSKRLPGSDSWHSAFSLFPHRCRQIACSRTAEGQEDNRASWHEEQRCLNNPTCLLSP